MLSKNISRIEVKCKVFGEIFNLWVDTGSPNTLVSSKLVAEFGLPPVGTRRYSGKVAGVQFHRKPSIMIPDISIPGCSLLKNIRALAALDGDEWNRTVILGLNVLNHTVYKIDRSSNTFEWLESLTANIPASTRTKFDHLIWNGTYLLSDAED
jgi:hypothetical protein